MNDYISIPEARNLLETLAKRMILDAEMKLFDAEKIYDWAEILLNVQERMYRKPYVRKAQPTSNKVDHNLREAILAYARVEPSATFMDIGHHFNVSIGRVSEILNGLR